MMHEEKFCITAYGIVSIGFDLHGLALEVFQQTVLTRTEFKESFMFDIGIENDLETHINRKAIFENSDSIIDELLSERKLCKIN